MIQYAKTNKYDIMMLQETHLLHGELTQMLKKIRKDKFFEVLEAPNTANKNKGGLAIITLKQQLQLKAVQTDSSEPSDWTQHIGNMPPTECDGVLGSSVDFITR